MPRISEEAQPLAEVLDGLTAEGELYEKLANNKVRCYACGHRCVILEGMRGICQVRYNANGCLRVPYGYVGALQCDPIEKKPFFHVYPSALALTFGMLGCDYHCAFCQNWLTSQALRDPVAGAPPQPVTPEELVAMAKHLGARMVASSYNEPLITAEWAVAVFKLAKAQGLLCGFISNGNATRETLEYLRPYVDAYKIDLKSMSKQNYRRLGGRLEHVLASIKMVHDLGFWEEIVTLVIPGWNDSEAELREAARYIASVSPDIPWHVTAFHKDYKMTEPENTTARHLLRAAEIGRHEGLRYVYAGNLPGMVGGWEHTVCPSCSTRLIERYGFMIVDYAITTEGTCPNCGTAIPGIWPPGGRAEVETSDTAFAYLRRLPRPVHSLRSNAPHTT